jgi:hypothetical protein
MPCNTYTTGANSTARHHAVEVQRAVSVDGQATTPVVRSSRQRYACHSRLLLLLLWPFKPKHVKALRAHQVLLLLAAACCCLLLLLLLLLLLDNCC